MADLLSATGNLLKSVYELLPVKLPQVTEQVVVVQEMLGVAPPARGFVRLAGLSGACAVSLGAYGSHVLRQKDVDPKLKETFEIANKYHYLHTLALLAVPLTRKPYVTGTLLTSGMLVFCGSCYCHALTGNNSVRKITPYGGFLLIFAWLSMAL